MTCYDRKLPDQPSLSEVAGVLARDGNPVAARAVRDAATALVAMSARIAELQTHVDLLARLSADTPQFSNYLEAVAAKTLRDEILNRRGTK